MLQFILSVSLVSICFTYVSWAQPSLLNSAEVGPIKLQLTSLIRSSFKQRHLHSLPPTASQSAIVPASVLSVAPIASVASSPTPESSVSIGVLEFVNDNADKVKVNTGSTESDEVVEILNKDTKQQQQQEEKDQQQEKEKQPSRFLLLSHSGELYDLKLRHRLLDQPKVKRNSRGDHLLSSQSKELRELRTRLLLQQQQQQRQQLNRGSRRQQLSGERNQRERSGEWDRSGWGGGYGRK